MSCEASKLQTAGKYDFCRLKAEAKAAKTAGTPDFSKCTTAYSTKWTQAETNAGGMCPSNGDEAAVQAFITEHTDALEAALDGGTLPEGVLTCNANLVTCAGTLNTCNSALGTCNGDLSTCDANDTTCSNNLGICNGGLTACDTNLGACNADLGTAQSSLTTCTGDLGTCQSDLATCQAQGLGLRLMTEQTTCYNPPGGGVIPCAGTGQDGELQKGLTISLTDNGDGTITDNRTTLMWEKLSDDGSIHDKDNAYVWADAFPHVASLNTTMFAGYTDWRLPNINELQSIVDYGAVNPAVNAAFNTGCVPGCTVTSCSCTPAINCWSSTPFQADPQNSWDVEFYYGTQGGYRQTNPFSVRAVRGGS